MSKQTAFWTRTWNVVHGCTKASEGCAHCHQLSMARRFHKHHDCWRGTVGEDGNWTGQINFNEAALDLPLKWKKPQRVFVNMTGDTFHENASFYHNIETYKAMHAAPQHEYIICTKRPENVFKLYDAIKNLTDFNKFCTDINYIILATTENQARFDERVPWLLKMKDLGVPRVGVIVEPMLENFRHVKYKLSLLDLVICGPENGPGKREFEMQWARDLYERCKFAGVPFFWKGEEGKGLPREWGE